MIDFSKNRQINVLVRMIIMTDIINKEQRSKTMRAVKSISMLEKMVSSELWKEGYRFRRNTKTLFGKPDISIKKYEIVIFIDSCFWHQCPIHGRMPKTNKEYWKPKLERNIERDREVNEYYLSKGWDIIRVWEHDIKEDFETVIKRLSKVIESKKGH